MLESFLVKYMFELGLALIVSGAGFLTWVANRKMPTR